ncbi:FxSxx-COOH system tetratricopeptide repeat protein [Dactylosporangium sp. CS-047395]|uniref:FxSxx-COOH system tetratricopeptide repeat protein n=1 Tax=Dactylosporangium sp. CS-047395 TaxID=3239936 RepID=UPI003D926590
MAALSFSLLGRVSAEADGQPIPLPPLTAAVLARLLLARGRLVTVDVLFADVWGDARRLGRRTDRTAVQKRISELRGVLGQDVLVTDAGSPTAYRLDVVPSAVDAFRFEAAVAAGDAAAARAVWRDEPLLGIDRPFADAARQRWTALLDRLADPAPDLARGLPPIWRMPARITGFVPRDDLLQQVTDRLDAGPVVLCGIGGVGKTRLAVEYAHRHAAGYDQAWWVDAEDADRIGDQLAALAVEAKICGPGTATPLAVTALHRHLRTLPAGRSLIVFDNADGPEVLTPHLPQGISHTLVTSRSPLWTEVATPVPVGVFDRAQSVEVLCGRVDGLAPHDADRLAARLGDLPLALAQAAGVMAAQGIPAAEYEAELDAHAAVVADTGRPASYPRSLAATVGVAADRLVAADRDLLDVCAVLAPEPVPVAVLRSAARGDGILAASVVEHATRYGLARVDGRGLLMHRLTQAIRRDSLDPAALAATCRRAERAVAAVAPDDNGDDPRTWPRWSALIPHALALDPAASDEPGLRDFAVRIPRHLDVRGDYGPALDLATRLHTAWQERLGPSHRHTLAAAAARLAKVLASNGDIHAGREIGRATLDRQRAALGPDDPDTLLTESVLTMILPDGPEGLATAEHNYQQRRRVLGPDHRDTLWSQLQYARRLQSAGQPDLAVDHARTAADGLWAALGDTHPWPSQALGSLASQLRATGRYDEALRTLERALPTLAEMFGAAHPETLLYRAELAHTLAGLGRLEAATAVAQDVVTLHVEALGAGHPWTVEIAEDLAGLLAATVVDGAAG